MPIYEYQCTSCYDIVEHLRSISERDLDTTCQVCGSVAQRVMSRAISFHHADFNSRVEQGNKQSGSDEYNRRQTAEFSSLSFTNCEIEANKVAISVPEGTQLILKDNKIKAPIPIEIRK